MNDNTPLSYSEYKQYMLAKIKNNISTINQILDIDAEIDWQLPAPIVNEDLASYIEHCRQIIRSKTSSSFGLFANRLRRAKSHVDTLAWESKLDLNDPLLIEYADTCHEEGTRVASWLLMQSALVEQATDNLQCLPKQPQSHHIMALIHHIDTAETAIQIRQAWQEYDTAIQTLLVKDKGKTLTYKQWMVDNDLPQDFPTNPLTSSSIESYRTTIPTAWYIRLRLKD